MRHEFYGRKTVGDKTVGTIGAVHDLNPDGPEITVAVVTRGQISGPRRHSEHQRRTRPCRLTDHGHDTAAASKSTTESWSKLARFFSIKWSSGACNLKQFGFLGTPYLATVHRMHLNLMTVERSFVAPMRPATTLEPGE